MSVQTGQASPVFTAEERRHVFTDEERDRGRAVARVRAELASHRRRQWFREDARLSAVLEDAVTFGDAREIERARADVRAHMARMPVEVALGRKGGRR